MKEAKDSDKINLPDEVAWEGRQLHKKNKPFLSAMDPSHIYGPKPTPCAVSGVELTERDARANLWLVRLT